jgi:3-oxoadipate CoA-transferase alpha subunit
MIDKFYDTPETAVADVHDGATVLISGFGGAGMPTELIHALIAQGARELTVVSNNAGNHETGLAALIKAGRAGRGCGVGVVGSFCPFTAVGGG